MIIVLHHGVEKKKSRGVAMNEFSLMLLWLKNKTPSPVLGL